MIGHLPDHLDIYHDKTKTLKKTANTTVHAIWGGVITFNTQGGNTIAPSAITRNTTSLKLPTPTRAGHHFDGMTHAIYK